MYTCMATLRSARPMDTNNRSSSSTQRVAGKSVLPRKQQARSPGLSLGASTQRESTRGLTTVRNKKHATIADGLVRQGLQAITAMAGGTAAVSKSDLLIVGPGVLGSLIGSQWLETHEGARVVGQTNTDRSHESLKALGIVPRLKADSGTKQFTNVIFCAPPSGSEDYTGEITAAAALWSGEGTLVFTSSSAVYSEKQGVVYTEESETVEASGSPRAAKLLAPEAAVLAAGGCVMRLAGLYTATRGAHSYFLKAKQIPIRPDGLINLIHYQDAASLCCAALATGLKGQIFMGCDSHPLTKAEMMEALYASKKVGDEKVEFTSSEGSLGRRMNNQKTRDTLQWEPTYSSFQAFAEAYGRGDATL